MSKEIFDSEVGGMRPAPSPNPVSRKERPYVKADRREVEANAWISFACSLIQTGRINLDDVPKHADAMLEVFKGRFK